MSTNGNDSASMPPPPPPPPPATPPIAIASTPEEEIYQTAGMNLSKGKEKLNGETSSASTSSLSGTKAPSVDTQINPRHSGTSADFAFEADMSKYPASMTSSVRAHVYEGGLRYHAYKDGKYAFPNDETEQNRDDMKHTMALMLTRGAFHYAPVEEVLKNGGEVLDLGTGTGIWAIELGDKYPNAKVTGIDLSPIQPNFVPENVHFFVDDLEEEWLDEANKYDYIHVRHVVYSIRDREYLLQQAMKHLKPGGYIEFQETHYATQSDDGTVSPTIPYALRDFINYLIAGMRALGTDALGILSLPDELKAAGFEEIKHTTHKAPIGSWPQDKRLRLAGLFQRTAIMDGLRGISRRPLMALGWTQLQIEMFLVDVRKALMDNEVHAYLTFHVVYARKPFSTGGGGGDQQQPDDRGKEES
ncbi:S-adenosyl-L-methionine-dependent methyltransferase [Rhypophila decipiens]|uniref:S-adenosyl-L-methionine-dependent methyltransferase n=1 Tax=Rhypophila decipiens TaxID=261697 RepID=A0AAN6XV97_9PEZI|nr:S-adenosyl-L-methionine-dependent methyltransferase [Rhypophila decipiens]